jgi:hypothetical protein
VKSSVTAGQPAASIRKQAAGTDRSVKAKAVG